MKRFSKFALFGLLAALLLSSTVMAQDEAPAFVVPLDHAHAPFLESYNYAVAQGATAEWRKMEGVAVDSVNNKLYIAISEIGKGMSDGEGDIQLEENICGAVYVADLDADMNISTLSPLVVGGPYDESDEENPCSVDSIANPDNVFVDKTGTVWIGEDTGEHANNMLWTWNGSELKRFATLPAGSEVTGLHISANGTVFMNVQHPDGVNIYPYTRGTIGVITGFTAGDAFEAIGVPSGNDAHKVIVAGGDYQVLGRMGSPIPNDIYGARLGQLDIADGSMAICNNPDGNMYLPVNEEGTAGYLYTNYECQPGGLSKLYIHQQEDGMWAVVEGENVDLMAVGGTWNNCFSSVTPWNTGLTSEEYPFDTIDSEWADNYAAMTDYLGAQANPYDYGYPIEIMPDSIGSTVVKHYVMGRFSHENSLVLSDGQTVYQSDDGTNRILWKFVASEAGDLSAGTLYAAKITQDGETLNVEWIELGTGSDDEIAETIAAMDLGQ
ncbi:MAG: DUF839 domain-containing protein [Caldilineaceae bacterium]